MNHVTSRIAIALLFFATSLETSHQSAFSAEDATSPKAGKTAQNRKTALQEMQAKYKDVKTLAAEFTQKQTNVALGTTKETSGHIFIKRPSMFRWQTEAPESEASILVGNGKKVWYYKPPQTKKEHGQVYIRQAADVQSQLAMDLLAGHADIKKDFKSKDLGPDHVELIPLKPAGDVERIELFLERPTKLVYKLVLFTMTGNQTELMLKNVVLDPKNPALGDKMFNFVAPEQTEEIY